MFYSRPTSALYTFAVSPNSNNEEIICESLEKILKNSDLKQVTVVSFIGHSFPTQTLLANILIDQSAFMVLV